HEEEQQDVDALDRILEQLELLVLAEGLGNATHLGLQALRHVRAHDDRADHVPLAPAYRPDRRDRLDQIARRQLADGGDLLTRQPALELHLAELPRGHVAERWILDVDDLAAARVENGQRADRQEVLLLDQEGGERVAAILVEEVLAVDHARDVLAVAQRRALEVGVIRLRHRQRLVERALHLRLEPALDRLVDEIRRDEEDQNRRRHREREERQDELGLEPRADDFLPALEAQLDEVAEEQEQQQQEDDQVQVEQREDHDVGRYRKLGRERAEVERREPAHQDEESEDDQQVALAAVGLREKRHGLLHPLDRAVFRLPLGLLGGARHARDEGVLTVERRFRQHADVEHLGRAQCRCRAELERAHFRKHPLSVAEVARAVRWLGLALERDDLVLLRHCVVGELTLDLHAVHQAVAPKTVVLPELDREPDVGRNPALQAFVERWRDRVQEHDAHGDLVVIEVDLQVT